MSALHLGDRVIFEDEKGHFTEGQVWSLHPDHGTYWVLSDLGAMYARKRFALNSMHTSHTQEALL